MKQLAILAALAVAPGAFGAVVITGQQVGNDVFFIGGGVLDVSLWTQSASTSISPLVDPDRLLTVGNGVDPVWIFDTPANFAGPAMIGLGTTSIIADFGTGNTYGLNWTDQLLALSVGYNSGDPVHGDATWQNHTLASLGLTPGTYTWTWDTLTGSDFFTINIVGVPAPGALALFAFAGIIGSRRRRL